MQQVRKVHLFARNMKIVTHVSANREFSLNFHPNQKK